MLISVDRIRGLAYCHLKMMSHKETAQALAPTQALALADLAVRPGRMTEVRWDEEEEQAALRYLEMLGFVTSESWNGYRQATRAGRDVAAFIS